MTYSPRAVEATTRAIPGLVWLRLGLCAGFRSPAAWRPHRSYRGLIVRIRWTVAGCGLYAIWMRDAAPEPEESPS